MTRPSLHGRLGHAAVTLSCVRRDNRWIRWEPWAVSPKAQQIVAAMVRTIFTQLDNQAAHAPLAEVANGQELRFLTAAQLHKDAEDGILMHVAPDGTFATAALNELVGTPDARDRPPDRCRGDLPKRSLIDWFGKRRAQEAAGRRGGRPAPNLSHESMNKLSRRKAAPARASVFCRFRSRSSWSIRWNPMCVS